MKYPVVAKVVGPVHKSDIGGVALNIRGEEHLLFEYERMMRLPGVTGIMVQPMLKGQELFLGAKYEDRFGHVVLCGWWNLRGGIERCVLWFGSVVIR
mgnify:CR=1 FL=1